MTLAVVTGANRGIGRSIAEGLVRGGHHVVMTGRRAGTIEEAAAETTTLGPGRAEGCVLDVPSDVDVAGFAEHLSTLGAASVEPLSILVNNAGVYLEAPHVEGTVKFANELRPHNISVNAMCPGWVQTDMGGPEGDRTPAEGADTALWLASLAPLEITGGFFTDRKRIPW